MTRAAMIFEAVVTLSGRDRAGRVAELCGSDAVLHAEVDALLAAHDAAGAFLAEPSAVLDDAAARVREAETVAEGGNGGPDRVIDRYTLLQPIGEGGFGTVWMAEQREPVRRRVAIKIIKPGMDSRQVLARFEAERQALALMDHPNIARVFDGGTTDAGRPYFVMEYIDGLNMPQYCDEARVGMRERLALFTQVCHALQHAHQKGIIHRDIKPSNVMVTLNDGRPVVKIIDFGIAKATNAELTNRTLFTEHGQMIGTPAYMSPEQAAGTGGLDIDTRSDIYSLGVLLYELLTGTTPFATDELLDRGVAEMLRVIREDEPRKPSTRLSEARGRPRAQPSETASGERTTSIDEIARQRGADARKLTTLLRGDLDWIVMKCLEKGRDRRYATAGELAADIDRHLANEPVTAGPPSPGYRIGKFVRRHRAGVIAGAVVVVAVTLGAAGAIAGMATARARAPQAHEYAARVLLERADELWPPDPSVAGMIGGLEAWIDDAHRFTRGLPDYAVRLAELEARPTAENEALRDVLSRLVRHLRAIGDDDHGLLAADAVVEGSGWSVGKRLELARAMAAGFAEGGVYATAWAAARADGLELSRQTGLLPLGRDPDSGRWEFAHLLSGAPAVRDEASGRLVVTEVTGLVLVLIPAGEFLMGAAPASGEHAPTVLSEFFISKYEMTQGQWKRLTGRNPSAFGPDGDWNPEWSASGTPATLLHPAEQVSWHDCDVTLRRAALTLPSEAQWEYAARAGTSTTFSTGPDVASLRGAANLRDERVRAVEPWAQYLDADFDGSAVHWPVGSGAPNPYGLHDVHGNVSEWCLDAPGLAAGRGRERRVDPLVSPTRDVKYVYRGGSWRTMGGPARSRIRNYMPPFFYGSGMGVRPARPVER